MKLYRVTARLAGKNGEWSYSVGVPTFLLEGCTDARGALHDARGALEVQRMCGASWDVAHITAVRVDPADGFPILDPNKPGMVPLDYASTVDGRIV